MHWLNQRSFFYFLDRHRRLYSFIYGKKKRKGYACVLLRFSFILWEGLFFFLFSSLVARSKTSFSPSDTPSSSPIEDFFCNFSTGQMRQWFRSAVESWPDFFISCLCLIPKLLLFCCKR